MLHGTEADNMAMDLVRSTIMAIRQTQPELALALTKQLGLSAMNGMSGMGDVLDDFATALSTLSNTAANIYGTKLQADVATNQAKQTAAAEAAKVQAALQQQQLQAQTQYAQQQLAQQQLQLQQYQSQLKAGTTNTMLYVMGAGLLAFLAMTMMGGHRSR